VTDTPINRPTIYVDADACPVKKEIYRVAGRHGLQVKVVANSSMGVPESESIKFVLAGDGFDAADDWIVERIGPNDIVITDDIPLASRSVKKGARALTPKGKEFTEDSVGSAMAGREVLSQLREHGMITGGPAPFQDKDRSRFLERFENIIRLSLKGG
jgi:uncharacterized protein YaiI (UPF0178 family)